jgi:hypothetical protein
MIWFLRIAFSLVLVSMLLVTSWASNQVALWAIPREVFSHPWFVATLFDTYFAFLTFYLWLAYKETGWLSRVLWLVAVLSLGNIAMAAYVLWKLFKLPSNAPLDALLLRTPSAN